MALPRKRSAFLHFTEPELTDAHIVDMYVQMIRWLAGQQVARCES